MRSVRRFRVVIAGGGVAALEALVALRELAGELVDIALLAPEREFVYRPLAVAEPFDLGSVQRFPLAALAGACDARHHVGALAEVYSGQHRIHTAQLVQIGYEALLIAIGVSFHRAISGALTFRGPEDVAAVRALVADLEAGRIKRVTFAVPSGIAWTLPLYELALLTADRLAREDVHAEIQLVTPEQAPLEVFGAAASARVRSLLEKKGIRLHTGGVPAVFERGELRLAPDGVVETEAVVALPSLRGRSIAGIPQDDEDFIPIDAYGRVERVASVYAAGDITAFPIKQGGLAAQQADVAAEAIAAQAGADVNPRRFRPVLRGLMVTGDAPTYLRAEIGTEDASPDDTGAIAWPPGKIVGRHLGPFLAEQAGLAFPTPPPTAGA
jgi:sulfide:quinone oxidoreductase